MGVHGLCIPGVEHKEIHHTPQIEHAPRAPAIMSDVRASHVARDQYSIGVMRTNSGIKHGPAAPRTAHAKIPRPLRPCAGQAENKSEADGYSVFHAFSGQKRPPAAILFVARSPTVADSFPSLESDPKPQPDRPAAINAF